jgi:cell division transport system ATP-binding protein
MIRFNQVHKRFQGGYEALKNVSFEVAEGEMVFVTGHSGAGKSTLLNLVAAIERPNSGSVVVKGKNVASLKSGALPYLRRNLGLIFQDHKLLFDRSVFENVVLPLQICGFDRRESAKRARAALDKVGLLQREKAKPVALSGGEQQRLCIARAIVNRPTIILADEPTGNLDTDYASDIIDILKSFHQVGVTLLIASHNNAIPHQLATRILTLQHGELLHDSAASGLAG